MVGFLAEQQQLHLFVAASKRRNGERACSKNGEDVGTDPTKTTASKKQTRSSNASYGEPAVMNLLNDVFSFAASGYQENVVYDNAPDTFPNVSHVDYNNDYDNYNRLLREVQTPLAAPPPEATTSTSQILVGPYRIDLRHCRKPPPPPPSPSTTSIVCEVPKASKKIYTSQLLQRVVGDTVQDLKLLDCLVQLQWLDCFGIVWVLVWRDFFWSFVASLEVWPLVA
ncbi:hypothetical protein ACLB2K_073437 [Fragaria x ananassa]